jgi:hypothetical protein
MQEQLKQSLLAEYPSWHDQPLSLKVTEIEDPGSVLSSFFTCYDLPDIRSCLKELLHDSLRAEGADAAGHVSTHQDIEKLIEAAWVIYQGKESSNNRKDHKRTQDQIHSKTEVLENGKLPKYYQSIHTFFDSFTLPFARSYVLSSIKAAEGPDIWKKHAPTDLLFFFESLDEIIDSVYSIVKLDNKTGRLILNKKNGSIDLNDSRLFCGIYDQHGPWDYFPRSLSAKEYIDPNKALQKFTSWTTKKEWKVNLRYILSYALGANSLSELGVNLELVRISELLQKMLDACHLIDVRTNIKKTNSEPEN